MRGIVSKQELHGQGLEGEIMAMQKCLARHSSLFIMVQEYGIM